MRTTAFFRFNSLTAPNYLSPFPSSQCCMHLPSPWGCRLDSQRTIDKTTDVLGARTAAYQHPTNTGLNWRPSRAQTSSDMVVNCQICYGFGIRFVFLNRQQDAVPYLTQTSAFRRSVGSHLHSTRPHGTGHNHHLYRCQKLRYLRE
jgi:hypothetical protein